MNTTFYFAASGSVTQNLFWLKHAASFAQETSGLHTKSMICQKFIWWSNSWTHVLFKGNEKVMKRSKRRLLPANGNMDPSVSLFQSASCSIDTNMPQHGTKSDWDAATFFIFPPVADCQLWPGYLSFSLTEGGHIVQCHWQFCKQKHCQIWNTLSKVCPSWMLDGQVVSETTSYSSSTLRIRHQSTFCQSNWRIRVKSGIFNWRLTHWLSGIGLRVDHYL